MPLGQVEGALSGGTNKSFMRKRHPDLGFTQNYISSSRETSVKAGRRICAVICRQKKGNIFFTETKQQHVPQRQIKNTYWNWCTGNKVVLCHWIIKFWAADARCPQGHSKRWSMSSVSGSTESQRVLTPETSGHLHWAWVTHLLRRAWLPECQGIPRAPKDVTCGTKRHSAVETRGRKVKSSGPGLGRRALPAQSSVEASSLGQLVCRGPRVSFKNVITTLTLY